MKHNHCHSCECEHENLKFCKTCDKPYCVDCGKEWNQDRLYTTWYSTTPSIYGTASSGTITTTGGTYASQIPCNSHVGSNK